MTNKIEKIFNKYKHLSCQNRLDSIDQVIFCNCNLLHLSIKSNNLNDVLELISYGADVNIKGESGLTPLHYACSIGNEKIIEILLKNGAEKVSYSDLGQTPLDIVKRRNFENKDLIYNVFEKHYKS